MFFVSCVVHPENGFWPQKFRINLVCHHICVEGVWWPPLLHHSLLLCSLCHPTAETCTLCVYCKQPHIQTNDCNWLQLATRLFQFTTRHLQLATTHSTNSDTRFTTHSTNSDTRFTTHSTNSDTRFSCLQTFNCWVLKHLCLDDVRCERHRVRERSCLTALCGTARRQHSIGDAVAISSAVARHAVSLSGVRSTSASDGCCAAIAAAGSSRCQRCICWMPIVSILCFMMCLTLPYALWTFVKPIIVCLWEISL